MDADLDNFGLGVVQRVRLLLQLSESLTSILLIELVPLAEFPPFLDELHLDEWTVHWDEVLDFFQRLVHRLRHVHLRNKRLIEIVICLGLAYYCTFIHISQYSSSAERLLPSP